MTGTTADGIVIERVFDAPRTAVFAAWTTPDHFARWFGGAAVQVPFDGLDFDAAPGNSWTAQMLLPGGTTIDWAGEFLEVVPEERLVLTITDRPAEPARAAIVVELTEADGGTLMRFTQETPGFTPEQQAGVLAGWQGFMEELAQIAAALPESG